MSKRSGQIPAVTNAAQPVRTRSGQDCVPHVRRPAGRRHTPECRGRRQTVAGRACRRGNEGVAAGHRVAGRPVRTDCGIRARRRPELAGSETLCHAGGSGGPVLEELHQLLAGVCGHVEGCEVQSILNRSNDACLMLTIEGIGTRAYQLRCRSVLFAAQRKSTGSSCRQSSETGSRGAK